MSNKNYKKTKYACYYTYLAMSSIFSLPPILFLTFRNMYGISYTLLGALVAINFCTQLTVDLIFSFFSRKFNIKKTVTLMPLITTLGLLIYALVPWLLPQFAYLGLVVGTVVFSVAAGLCEVLLSPTVAAIPSDTPEKDMSMLHSLYAYGVVTVVVLSSVFLKIFGTHNWMYLTIFWAVLPVISFVLFKTSPMPDMDVSHGDNQKSAKGRNFGLILCIMCIFLGSAAENSMTNWISGYMEKALGISKTLGDILGMTTFAILLGLGRTWYAKYGKNIINVLLVGMLGAAVCYIIIGFSNNVIVSMLACVLTGLFTSMLWPGTLILMEEKIPGVGVAAYALMASGGDFGASIAPMSLGVVVDKVSESAWGINMADNLSVNPEQLGLKVGMLCASVFPIVGTLLLIYMKRYFKKSGGETL